MDWLAGVFIDEQQTLSNSALLAEAQQDWNVKLSIELCLKQREIRMDITENPLLLNKLVYWLL